MSYSDLKKNELKALLDERGVDYASDAKNDELRDLLEANDSAAEATPSEPAADDQVEDGGDDPKPVGGQKQYLVSCDCPTPLACNPFKCLAISEAEAVDRFKRRNGIVQTDHKIEAVLFSQV